MVTGRTNYRRRVRRFKLTFANCPAQEVIRYESSCHANRDGPPASSLICKIMPCCQEPNFLRPISEFRALQGFLHAVKEVTRDRNVSIRDKLDVEALTHI